MYPISVNLEGKTCIVAGGGKIAYKKLLSLLKEKAVVTVISPIIIPEIEKLYTEGKINVLRRKIVHADYSDAFLIIAATNDHSVNREIYENVKNTKLVNVVSESKLGNFHIPASLVRGKLLISVSTGGASPMLAKQIRDELEVVFDETYEEYLEFLHDARMMIKNSSYEKVKKNGLYKELLEKKYRDSLHERNIFLNTIKHSQFD